MKIEALDRDMQPAANKRNIALFQRHMEQALGIPASRGYLRFVPVPEDCAGWKSNTIAGEISEAKDRAQASSEAKVQQDVSRNDKQSSDIGVDRDYSTAERYNYKSTQRRPCS
ncbi:hypothetical protein ACHAQC_001429 [Fusarium culmorum]